MKAVTTQCHSSEREEHPLDLLYSSDSDDQSARLISVQDKDSCPRYVYVNTESKPCLGIIDTSSYITTVGGDLFKKIATVSRLKKRFQAARQDTGDIQSAAIRVAWFNGSRHPFPGEDHSHPCLYQDGCPQPVVAGWTQPAIRRLPLSPTKDSLNSWSSCLADEPTCHLPTDDAEVAHWFESSQLTKLCLSVRG